MVRASASTGVRWDLPSLLKGTLPLTTVLRTPCERRKGDGRGASQPASAAETKDF